MSEQQPSAVVYMISDSLGDTGEQVLRASLSQFQGQQLTVKRFPLVSEITEIDRIVEQALAERTAPLLMFTLVVPEIRDHLLRMAHHYTLPVFDVLTPIIDFCEGKFRSRSACKPGIQHRMDDEQNDQNKRIEAIRFAERYDDGRDASGLARADIVLLGVSRTGKTPLSTYLATKGFKVMNVPLVPEVKPMQELFKTNPRKLIGLRIAPDVLQRIRLERLEVMGLDERAPYASADRIRYELDYANQVLRALDCVTIDVSNRAMEELSAKILSLFT